MTTLTLAPRAQSSTSLSLYELSEEQNALDALLALDEGECTPESDALTAELAGKLARKADSFGAYVRVLESADDTISDEIARLGARRRAIGNKVERLKRYGLMALQAMQRTKVEGALFTLAVQNNPARVEISCAVGELPAEYVRTVPASYEVDKAALSRALKAGAVVEGATLVVSQSLRVR